MEVVEFSGVMLLTSGLQWATIDACNREELCRREKGL